MVALLLAWAALSFSGSLVPASRVDSLIARGAKTLRSASCLTGSYTEFVPGGKPTAKMPFALTKRYGYFAQKEEYRVYYNPQTNTQYIFQPKKNAYFSYPMPSPDVSPVLFGLQSFFGPDAAMLREGTTGQKVVFGAHASVSVQVRGHHPGSTVVFLNPKTGIPMGWRAIEAGKTKTQTVYFGLDLRPVPGLRPGLWLPPQSAHKMRLQ